MNFSLKQVGHIQAVLSDFSDHSRKSNSLRTEIVFTNSHGQFTWTRDIVRQEIVFKVTEVTKG